MIRLTPNRIIVSIQLGLGQQLACCVAVPLGDSVTKLIFQSLHILVWCFHMAKYMLY